MKIKTKKIVSMAILGMLVLPVAVHGQWDSVGYSAIDNSTTGLQGGTITLIATGVMKWILGLVGLFGIIGFAVAGIFYLTAAGNDDQMEKGKNGMVWSIIGVIVALMGFVIIQAVDTMLAGGSTF